MVKSPAPYEARIGQLRLMVPQLFKEPGTLLYVGACERRCQCAGQLFKAGNELTALEIWDVSLEKLKASRMASWFTHFVLGDVRELGNYKLPHDQFDYGFWWHGPEHVSCHEFVPTVKKLETITKKIVVLASPWGRAFGPVVFGNPHNAHRCYLHIEDYMALGYRVAAIGPKNKPFGNILAWKDMQAKKQGGERK